MLSEDGTHPQHDGVQQDGVPARPGSDVSMLSRSNSQGALEPDSADASSLIGRKRSSSKLNPPKEEDRTLPLKKLFENLTGVTEANQVQLLSGYLLSKLGGVHRFARQLPACAMSLACVSSILCKDIWY